MRVPPSTTAHSPRPGSPRAGRRAAWRDLIDAAPHAPDQRPVIFYERPWGAVPLHRIVPQAVETLASCGAGSLYAHGEVLARLVTHAPTDPPAGEIRRTLAPRIAPLSDALLRLRLDEAACWRKEVLRKNGERVEVEAWVPRAVSDAVRDLGCWPGVCPLLGVVTAPTLRPDATVLCAPGYDAASAIYLAPGAEYPPVPDTPCEAEVVAALQALLAPFGEFDFALPADRASLLAYMLTLAGRPAIAGPVPLLVVTAPAYGSGKTLLVEAATVAMTGHPPDLLAPVGGRPSDAEAEMRKRLTTLVQEAPRAACVDNLEDGATFTSRVFSMLLTTDLWTDRLLGSNRRVRLPHHIAWSVTGCNVKVAGDLARRALSIALDPGVEDPHLRRFEVPDLGAHVARLHPRLLTAALTILRGYVGAGRPAHGRAPLGKFEAWDGLVRGAVLWATRLVGQETDPLDTQGRLLDATPDKDGLGGLLRAWQTAFGTASTTCREAIRRATEPGGEPLADAIVGVGADKDGRPDARRLGHYLGAKVGSVVGGLTFEHRGDRQKVAQWGVAQRAGPRREAGG